MIEFLQAGFVQRAFVIGAIVGLLSSVLSPYIVLKRLSLIGDGLAHTAYGGISIGLLTSTLVPAFAGVDPYWVGGIVVVAGSILITKAIRSARLSGDAAVAVFLELGLATGVFVTSVTLNYGFALDNLLFGSILLVSWTQVGVAAVVLGLTGVVVLVYYKQLLYTMFDEIQARAAGIVTWKLDYLLAVLAGIAVVVSIPIVGILLISALLVIPGLASVQVARSFRETAILSPVFGFAAVILGLLVSITLPRASPGGAVVLVALAMLLCVMAGRKLVSRRPK